MEKSGINAWGAGRDGGWRIVGGLVGGGRQMFELEHVLLEEWLVVAFLIWWYCICYFSHLCDRVPITNALGEGGFILATS